MLKPYQSSSSGVATISWTDSGLFGYWTEAGPVDKYMLLRVIRLTGSAPWTDLKASVGISPIDHIFVNEDNIEVYPLDSDRRAFLRVIWSGAKDEIKLEWVGVKYNAVVAYIAENGNFESFFQDVRPQPVVVYMMDASGSMTEPCKEIVSEHLKTMRSWAETSELTPNIGAIVLKSDVLHVIPTNWVSGLPSTDVEVNVVDEVSTVIGAGANGKSPIGELVAKATVLLGPNNNKSDEAITLILFTDGKENDGSPQIEDGPNEPWTHGTFTEWSNARSELVVLHYGELPAAKWHLWQAAELIEQLTFSEIDLDVPNAIFGG